MLAGSARPVEREIMELAIFIITAVIALVGAGAMLVSRNAVHSALFLLVNFGAIAVLFLLLRAPFLFAVQLIVYAGAIMVLFLFVVMLLNAPQEETPRDRQLHRRLLRGAMRFGAILSIGFAAELAWILTRTSAGGPFQGVGVDSVAAIGRTLFTTYAFAFEVTSVLILVALLGAVTLARREDAEHPR